MFMNNVYFTAAALAGRAAGDQVRVGGGLSSEGGVMKEEVNWMRFSEDGRHH